MPAQSEIEILPSELTQIVESVFGTMLRLELAECAAPWFPSEDRLASVVHLSGDWNGAVLFECGRDQACRFAGRFLSMDPPKTVDDVVRDVVGELANMIGGNLKCVMTHGIRLSIPSVIDGGALSLHLCGAEIHKQLAFECDEGLFWVTVLTDRSCK